MRFWCSSQQRLKLSTCHAQQLLRYCICFRIRSQFCFLTPRDSQTEISPTYRKENCFNSSVNLIRNRQNTCSPLAGSCETKNKTGHYQTTREAIFLIHLTHYPSHITNKMGICHMAAHADVSVARGTSVILQRNLEDRKISVWTQVKWFSDIFGIKTWLKFISALICIQKSLFKH